MTAATGGAAAGLYSGAGLTAGALYGAGTASFAGGAIAGGAGALLGSPIRGIGNAIVFGDEYNGKRFLQDVAGGVVLGGVSGAVSGYISNVRNPGAQNNIWTGRPVADGRSMWSFRNTPIGGGRPGTIEIGEMIGEWPDGRKFSMNNGSNGAAGSVLNAWGVAYPAV